MSLFTWMIPLDGSKYLFCYSFCSSTENVFLFVCFCHFLVISERENWELCNKCNMMRPKRSHHCSRCGHCVRRMDHHCPWINNCVGEDNHWLFLQLCFYTQVLSLYTLVLDFCQYYYFQPLSSVDRVRRSFIYTPPFILPRCLKSLEHL
uniref:Palmitoyltransferase n=1 Tax=Cyprinus carpio TaxID=7962 RepID=A0A8C1R2V4_CYPCA